MNKKTKLIILFIISMAFLISCKSTKLQTEDLVSYDFNDETFTFTGKRPYVKIELGDECFLFLIDTGSNYNYLTDSGLDKICRFMKIDSKKELVRKAERVVLSESENASRQLSFEFNPKDKSDFDGILGTPFLQYRGGVVIFDYENQSITFGAKKIDGERIPLVPICFDGYKNLGPFLFYKAMLNNQEEYFILDTGNDGIAIRTTLNLKTCMYPESARLFELMNGDYKKSATYKKIKIESLKIGKTEYANIEAVYGDYFWAKTNIIARKILTEFSSAGYAVFQNKKIIINTNENYMIIKDSVLVP